MKLGFAGTLATLAAAALTIVVVAPTAAAPLDGSPFDATDGVLDEIAGIGSVEDVASGKTDDSYKMGAKEDDPCPTVALHKNPPHKDDLLALWGGSSGSVVYLAWSRAPGGQGTATLDFELNRRSTTCANGVNPLRTPGDLLFGYDFRGGHILGLDVRIWDGSKWGTPVALDPAFAQAGISGDELFGELAVDVKKIPGIGTGPCVTLTRGFVKSRASTSFSSEMKDLIRGVPLTVTTCIPT